LCVIACGVYVIIDGGTGPGIGLVLLGTLHLVLRGRGDIPGIDPILQAELETAQKLMKKDPAAADALLDKAFADAERRQEAELSVLRQRASTDQRAAMELRDRLRRKLRNQQRVRRRVEQPAPNPPNRVALLEGLDRAASQTERELAHVEQYLEEWRER